MESGYTVDGVFYPMDSSRRWKLVYEADGTPKGVYFTDEENAARDAEEAAYEPIRLAGLKAGEIEQAIQALAPMLQAEFASLTQDEQVEFAGDFDSVEKRLNNGQVAFARAIIAAKKPQTENGIAVQGRLLAGLDSVIAVME